MIYPVAGWTLLARLALRRDRWRLLAIGIGISLLPLVSFASYAQLFPDPATRTELALTIGANPAFTVLFGQAQDLTTAGGFTAWRTSSFCSLFLGLFAVFTVVRHTRAEEDASRAELIHAGSVGRFASLFAALAHAALSCLAVGSAITVGLIAAGSALPGAAALGATTAASGLFFGSVAAVTAQLAAYARSANGMAVAALGGSFLLRGWGDSAPGRAGAAWASPFGWIERVRPYEQERWSVLLAPISASVLCVAVAAALLARRDLGHGTLPPRDGSDRASRALLAQPFGLVWRLQRRAIGGWALGCGVAGLVFGSLLGSVGKVLGGSELARRMLGVGITARDIDRAFLSTMITVFALFVSLAGVHVVLRARSEESAGRLDSLVVAGSSRLSWLGSYVFLAAAASTALSVVGGLALGLAGSGGTTFTVGDTLAASLRQLPSCGVLIATAVALVGGAQRHTALAWVACVVSFVITFFGPLLQLPSGILNLSPFSQLPGLSSGPANWPALVILTLLGLCLTTLGMYRFRERDLS